MRSRAKAGSTDQDWGEKRAQNMECHARTQIQGNVQTRIKSKTGMHTYRCKDKHRHIQIHRDIRTDALTDRHRNTHIYLQVHIQKHVQSHTQADTVTHEQIQAHTHMERYAHIRTRRRTYQYTLHFQSSRQMYRRMQTHKWTDIHRDTS